MMKFALLCSGSRGNSFLLRDEHTCILVDCGSTKRYLRQCFEQLNFDPAEIDAVLITHDHSDHVSQVGMFADHVIYSPVGLKVPTQPVVPQQPLTIGHLTVTPVELSHDAPHTVGYIFQSWQEKLVYITDTGYVKYSYVPLLKGADYIILESNHDVEMLMHTSRPAYLKARIAGDDGHLCNEDCASLLQEIVTPRTKQIVLAHISQEANTRQRALSAAAQALQQVKDSLNPHLQLAAAGQFEMIQGGSDEKVDLGSVVWTAAMERGADH